MFLSNMAMQGCGALFQWCHWMRYHLNLANQLPTAKVDGESIICTCGPNWELAWRWWLKGAVGVTVRPDRAVIFRGQFLSSDQKLEPLVAEESVHQAQIQARHTGPIQNQDLIPCFQPWVGERRLSAQGSNNFFFSMSFSSLQWVQVFLELS